MVVIVEEVVFYLMGVTIHLELVLHFTLVEVCATVLVVRTTVIPAEEIKKITKINK